MEGLKISAKLASVAKEIREARTAEADAAGRIAAACAEAAGEAGSLDSGAIRQLVEEKWDCKERIATLSAEQTMLQEACRLLEEGLSKLRHAFDDQTISYTEIMDTTAFQRRLTGLMRKPEPEQHELMKLYLELFAALEMPWSLPSCKSMLASINQKEVSGVFFSVLYQGSDKLQAELTKHQQIVKTDSVLPIKREIGVLCELVGIFQSQLKTVETKTAEIDEHLRTCMRADLLGDFEAAKSRLQGLREDLESFLQEAEERKETLEAAIHEWDEGLGYIKGQLDARCAAKQRQPVEFGPSHIKFGWGFYQLLASLEITESNRLWKELAGLYLVLLTIKFVPSLLGNCKSILKKAHFERNVQGLFSSLVLKGDLEALEQKFKEHPAGVEQEVNLGLLRGTYSDQWSASKIFGSYLREAIRLSPTSQGSTGTLQQASSGESSASSSGESMPAAVRTRRKKVAYYAPYIALCQSSGTGKSRLIMENSGDFWIFYCCLRARSSSGVPLRSTVADHLTGLAEIGDFFAFLLATMKVWTAIQKELGKSAQCQSNSGDLRDSRIWLHRQIFDRCFERDFWNQVAVLAGRLSSRLRSAKDDEAVLEGTGEEVARLLVEPMVGLGEERGQAAVSIEETVVEEGEQEQEEEEEEEEQGEKRKTQERQGARNARKEFAGPSSEALEVRLSAHMGVQYNEARKYAGNKPFIFVFDEAGVLINKEDFALSPFFNLRRALRTFHGQMLAVFLDTTSRIANFVPPAIRDPSSRISMGGKELFRPFFFLPFLGAVKVSSIAREDRLFALTVSTSTRFICWVYDPLEMIELGRPLFPSHLNLYPSQHYDPDSVEDAARRIISYASSKLNGEAPKPSTACWLACLCLRFGLVVNRPDLAETLLSTHLACCWFVSHDRLMLVVNYPSEPLLADAAANLLQGNFAHSLSVLLPRIRLGGLLTASGGTVGELVAMVVLARSYDLTKAAEHGPVATTTVPKEKRPRLEQTPETFVGTIIYSRPVCVSQWLQVFLSAPELKLVEGLGTSRQIDMERLLCSRLSFTHFVRIDRAIDQHLLLEAYQRRVALIAKMQQSGFDLAIPLVRGVSQEEMEAEVRAGRREGWRSVQGPTVYSPTAEDMGVMLIQVKNYHSGPLPQSKANEALGRLERELKAFATRTRPCISLLMQVGPQGIGGFGEIEVPEVGAQKGRGTGRGTKALQPRIVARNNILRIVKPMLDEKCYAFLSSRELGLLHELGTVRLERDRLRECLSLVEVAEETFNAALATSFGPIQYSPSPV